MLGVSTPIDCLSSFAFTDFFADTNTTKTAEPNGESLESYLTAEGGAINFDIESDLLSTMPTWETSTLGFGDELELGHFFASDSQRWFEQTQW
jgi:hypothetical protein